MGIATIRSGAWRTVQGLLLSLSVITLGVTLSPAPAQADNNWQIGYPDDLVLRPENCKTYEPAPQTTLAVCTIVNGSYAQSAVYVGHERVGGQVRVAAESWLHNSDPDQRDHFATCTSTLVEAFEGVTCYSATKKFDCNYKVQAHFAGNVNTVRREYWGPLVKMCS